MKGSIIWVSRRLQTALYFSQQACAINFNAQFNQILFLILLFFIDVENGTDLMCCSVQ